MSKNMYSFRCNGMERACRMIMRFINDADIYMPECTLLGPDNNIGLIPAEETANAERLMAYLKSHGSKISVVCTAATDQQDINRVVLGYIEGLNFLTLSFPMAQEQLSEKEKAILKRMSSIL